MWVISDFIGNFVKRHQPQAIECQESHTQQCIIARVFLLVHGNADNICHDLSPHIRACTATGQAPVWEFVLCESFSMLLLTNASYR